MKFRLDPSSGYAGSYLDIQFVISFDQCDRAEITLLNKLNNQAINILSGNGRILNNTVLIIEKSNVANGYINIFNYDKMNYKIEKMPSIEIFCRVTRYISDEVLQEDSICEFYNESMSLDREIAPFDIQIENQEINLDINEPLKLTIISSKEEKYELALKSVIGNTMYVFEILSHKGKCSFEIPAEVLSYHLNLSKPGNKLFLLHFVKYEGITPSGHMNRKFIPLANAEIRFHGTFKLLPQDRKGPDGTDLSKDFILSDRYFVHTWKEFSSYTKRSENIQTVSNMPRLLNEVYSIRKTIKQAPETLENKRILKKESYKEMPSKFVKSSLDFDRKSFFNQISHRVTTKTQPQKKIISSEIRKSGGCGCSRQK